MAHVTAMARDSFVDFFDRGFDYEKFDISLYARLGGDFRFDAFGGGYPNALVYSYQEDPYEGGAVVARGGNVDQWDNNPPTGTVTEFEQYRPFTGSTLLIKGIASPARNVDKAINSRNTEDDAALLESWLSGSDVIELTWEWDRARGYGGNDEMHGDNGWDVLFGDDGNDTLDGGEGGDELWGGLGNDLLLGGAEPSFNENDTLNGGSGDDTLIGATGDDALRGGAGADMLAGGRGADTMVGGAGDDIYVVDRGRDRVMEFVPGGEDPGGVDEVRSSVDWALGAAFEHLRLEGSARTGAGNAAANRITGNAERNDLDGLDGNDTLVGGEGSDWLTGGAGSDVVAGGAGRDVVEVASRVGAGSDSRARSVAGANNDRGADTLEGFGFGRDVILVRATGVASFVHGRDTDIGAGRGMEQTGGRTSFSSHSGLIELNQAHDRNWLDAGDIVLTFQSPSRPLNEADFEASLRYALAGTSGADTLTGGAQNDRLAGHKGADVLTGAGGRDVFVLTDAADAPLAGRIEIVTDFTRGQDTIDLRGIDANVLASGNQAFGGALIAASAAFTTPGQLRLKNGVLYGNIDLDEAAEFAIALPGVAALSAGDLLL